MRLHITPTYTFLSGRVPADVWQQITETLRYTEQEYVFIPSHGKQWQSRQVSLVGQTADYAYFPSGLLPRVAGLLARYVGVGELTGIDEPAELPHLVPVLPNGTALYEDQLLAGQAALTKRRGLMALATNFGKTELMAALLETLAPRRALVLVNQRVLVLDTAKRLDEALRGQVSLVGAGRKARVWNRVTVATIQALYHARNTPELHRLLAGIEVLLVDEVHTVSPKSWFPILERCTNAWFRLGLSGTIREATHQLPLEAFFGPIFHEITDAELIQQGRSATTTVLMPRCGNTLEESNDYDVTYQRGIIAAPGRNQLLARFAATAAKLDLATIVSFYRHEHGEVLERYCREDYLGPVHRVDGRTPLTQAERVKTDVAAGVPGIYLLGVSYNKGVNLPGARVMINAAAWRSPLTTSQRSGRVIRRKPDNWAVVVDPYDLGNTTLKNQSADRRQTYERKGFQVEVDAADALLGRLAALAAAGAPAATR
jgi:superfamily II DNA or RNA helicase